MAGEVLDVHGLAKPLLRGRVHLVAFAVSVPAAVLLVAVAGSVLSRAAAVVYGLSLAALFGVSSTYHGFVHRLAAQLVLRRVDHAMIYGLIAGSYTPVALLAVRGWLGWALAGAVWALAAFGMLLKVAWFDKAQVLGWVLYLGLGWLAVVAAPELLDHLSGAELVLLVSGGLLYTVGALILGRRWPNPHPRVFGYHEVWHTLVVVAAACHYAAIWPLVRAG